MAWFSRLSAVVCLAVGIAVSAGTGILNVLLEWNGVQARLFAIARGLRAGQPLIHTIDPAAGSAS